MMNPKSECRPAAQRPVETVLDEDFDFLEEFVNCYLEFIVLGRDALLDAADLSKIYTDERRKHSSYFPGNS